MRLSFRGDRCAAQPGLRVERDGPSGADGACLAPEALDDLWRSLEAASVPDLRLVSLAPETVTRVEITGDNRRGWFSRACQAAPGDSRAPRCPMRPIHA